MDTDTALRTIDDLPLIDMHDPAFLTDPHAVLRPLQREWPLVRSRRGIEVIRYDWNVELYADRRFDTPGVEDFISKGVPPMFRAFLEHGFLLGFHGERHDLIRRVLQKGFSIRRIDEQRDLMRSVAEELVDRFIDRDEVDFVSEFTQRFPVITLCRLLGVPKEDIPRFHEAAVTLHLMGAVPIAPGFPQIEEALSVLYGYVADLVARRRREPAEDFISALIEAEATEGRLTEEELSWNVANLLFAGQDTTRFQLASVVSAILGEPGDVWSRLAAEPDLIPRAISEGVRLHPAAQWNSRRALEDAEYRGFRFAKGQWVFLNNMAGGRDPQHFAEPDRFDLARSERFETPFGRGLHHCLGQMLAKRGMEEALFVLTQRLADVRMPEAAEWVRPTSMIGGPEAMPLSFRPR